MLILQYWGESNVVPSVQVQATGWMTGIKFLTGAGIFVSTTVSVLLQVLPTLLQWEWVVLFLWNKSSQKMKLTNHLYTMVNVWSYTFISPYIFMACVLLKHIYMYGFVCKELGQFFIFLVTQYACYLVPYVHCIFCIWI